MTDAYSYRPTEQEAQQKPAAFRYLTLPGQSVSSPEVFAQAIEASDSFSALGERLAKGIGAVETRDVFSAVKSQAEGDLLVDPQDRVAKSAVRWANRAEERIQTSRYFGTTIWEDPGQDEHGGGWNNLDARPKRPSGRSSYSNTWY